MGGWSRRLAVKRGNFAKTRKYPLEDPVRVPKILMGELSHQER
jgi:hypothetical protein